MRVRGRMRWRNRWISFAVLVRCCTSLLSFSDTARRWEEELHRTARKPRRVVYFGPFVSCTETLDRWRSACSRRSP